MPIHKKVYKATSNLSLRVRHIKPAQNTSGGTFIKGTDKLYIEKVGDEYRLEVAQSGSYIISRSARMQFTPDELRELISDMQTLLDKIENEEQL